MVRKIKFFLILLLLVFITLGASQCCRRCWHNCWYTLISDSAVSYEPISYNWARQDIMTASVSPIGQVPLIMALIL